MANFFYWIISYCILTSFTNLVKGECELGQTEIDGKCFHSQIIGRNRIIDFEWRYSMSLTDVSLTKEDIVDLLRPLFIEMSERFKDYSLDRGFCTDDTCDSLEINVQDTGEGEVLCDFYIENVFGIINESPVIISPDLLEKYVNENFFTLDIGDSDYNISHFILDHTIYCKPGNEKLQETSKSARCGACLEGQYLDSDTKECTLCPLATYQDEPEQEECEACRDGLSTENEGSTSEDSCQVFLECGPGQYIKLGFCEKCEIGTYKPGTNRETSCSDCNEGWTTYGSRSDSEEKCVETCLPGWLLQENGTCVACPQGTFLSEPFLERECSMCPDGLTTDGEGTASEDLCYNVICPAGEERNGSNPGECTECPQGMYNPDEGGKCLSCGDPMKWRTESAGATSVEECRFYCPGGQFVDVALPPPVCEACPPDTYKEPDIYYATQCTECPPVSPKTLGPGSDGVDDCKYAQCSAGQYIDPDDTLTCEDCDYGYYQGEDDPILQTCQSCPDMQSTGQKGSTSKDQCQDYCPSGSELTDGGECVHCAIGYYKSNEAGISQLFGRCQLCPVQYVTEEIGATSEDDCNIANCSQGYYLTESKLTCAKCPRGQYQDERYQTECKPCPDTESSTAQEGSTSTADCTVYTNRVRYAIKIKFNMDWTEDYYNHASSAYQTLSNRILKQVNRTLLTIESYREGLVLNALAEGSVDAHMMAKFHSLNPNIEEDLDRVLRDAIDTGAISSEVVEGTDPLPVDKRLELVYEYAEKVTRVPDVCPYGMYFNYNSKQCVNCPVGSYQPDGVGDICLNCPEGYSTENTASKKESDCLLVCEAGNEMDGGTCTPCEKGTYKSTIGIEACTPCGPNQMTVATGATSDSDCIASCSEGEYSNEEKLCNQCPQNTYNPNTNQVECLDCPLNYRTRGTGSINMDQCLDPCEFDEPCLNGGSCLWNSGSQTYSCVCTEEYVGALCQTLSDICERASPCRNGATCEWSIVEESFSCLCTEDYKGTLCENLKNVCINGDPCQNGATCDWDQVEEVSTCMCTSEYIGELCDLIKNVCIRADPCKNGGTCQWSEAEEDYNCICTEDYSGKICDTLKASTENDDNTAIYIGVGAGVGALLLLIIIIIGVCRYRRKPKQHKPPLPSAVAVTANNNNIELGDQASKPKETSPTMSTITEEPPVILPPLPTIPPPPIPESPLPTPPPHPRKIEPEYSMSQAHRLHQGEDPSKTVTTVAMSSSTERISHRSVQPPDSPPQGSPSRRRSRSRSPKRHMSPGRPASGHRLRRLESEIPDGATSMPMMTNPLLEENLPPADYPFDPPPAGLDYPEDRRPRVHWNENDVVPPPYSKKDPSKKKKGHKQKKHSKGKKHVRIDTDRNVEHKLSVRSNASSHHTYMDMDPQIDYIQPSHGQASRTVPGPSRGMTFNSPIYETLN